MSVSPMIRPVSLKDAPAITAIYNPYIRETVITFEEEAVTAGEIEKRIQNILSLGYPYLVMELEKRVIAYAYAGQWRSRSAYRHTVETSIYLERNLTGKGFGSTLYQALLDEIRKLDIHIVLGGITLPNPASVRLHEKLGFKKVAHFNEAGYKFGQWLDVGFWQLSLPV